MRIERIRQMAKVHYACAFIHMKEGSRSSAISALMTSEVLEEFCDLYEKADKISMHCAPENEEAFAVLVEAVLEMDKQLDAIDDIEDKGDPENCANQTGEAE